MPKPEAVWVVRAGVPGWKGMPEQCWEKGCVAVGWPKLGDLRQWETREALKEAYRAAYPEHSAGRVNASLGQLWALSHEILPGHWVVTPDSKGKLMVGEVTRGYRYSKSALGVEAPHVVSVKWLARVGRKALDNRLRRTLRCRSIVFRVIKPEAIIRAVFKPTCPTPREIQRLVRRAAKGTWNRTEAATINKIVVPVLQKLGWHRDEIEQELRVRKGSVDLALCRDGKPYVFIEAKVLGSQFTEDGGEVSQAIHYAVDAGVEWAVLTDGGRWWVYDPFLRAENRYKRVLEIDLLKEPPDFYSPDAILLLSPEAVIGGRLREFARRAVWVAAVRSALRSPSEELVEAVRKQAGIEGDEAALKEVLAHFGEACPPPPLPSPDC